MGVMLEAEQGSKYNCVGIFMWDFEETIGIFLEYEKRMGNRMLNSL